VITLTLDPAGRSWLATTTGPAAAQLIDLFGTATLPCAFTVDATADEVLREIRKLNPTETVTLAEDKSQ
jgi:hypothetical protein